MPIPDGSVYTMLQVDGHDLGALYENKEHPPSVDTRTSTSPASMSRRRGRRRAARTSSPSRST